MFTIVSMQDTLVNLNGSDSLFKRFDRPRIKKTATGKVTKERTPSFNIRNIWILPGHILVLCKDQQTELLSYDQLPKLTAYSDVKVNLLEAVTDDSGVLDLCYDFVKFQYVFIVLKSGLLVSWCFLKPSFEWKHVLSLSLSKVKNTVLSSFTYNEHNKCMVWCEKIPTGQFCIYSANIVFNEVGNGQISISNNRAVLHNCLPMNVRLLSKDIFCFVPSAPPGLMLFWSMQTDAINVHMWGETFDTQSIPTKQSDFQSIVTSSISLWINSLSSDSKIKLIVTHPSTNELVILQNDLHVYLVKATAGKGIQSFFLCHLEVENENENFSNQILNLFPVQRLFLVLMMDGVISIFDTHGGLFLWTTSTFKSNSPNIWIRKGLYSSFGVWNKSGIWNLRPKPISEQIQEFYRLHGKEDEDTDESISDVEHALDVFEEHKKQEKRNPRRRIKQGVNRSDKLPIDYLLEILTQWKLTNVSMEMALTTTLRIKDALNSNASDEDLDMNEVSFLIEEIKDPVLLLVLFTDKNLPVSVKRHIVHYLKTFLLSPTSKHIEPKILKILKEFVSIEEKIHMNLSDVGTLNLCRSVPENLMEIEHAKIEKICLSANVDKTHRELYLKHLWNLQQKSLMCYLMSTLMPADQLVGTIYEREDEEVDYNEVVSNCIWETLLRKNGVLLGDICVFLWNTSPSMMLCFIKHAAHILDTRMNPVKETITSTQLISKVLQLIYLPYSETKDDNLLEKINTYCSCLQLSGLESSEDEAYDIYIRYRLVSNALSILHKYVDHSEKHYSMFFKLFVSLIETKTIGDYIHELKELLPEKFNMAEVNNILCNHCIDIGGGPVFVKGRGLSIETFRPLLEIMLA